MPTDRAKKILTYLFEASLDVGVLSLDVAAALSYPCDEHGELVEPSDAELAEIEVEIRELLTAS